jgi:FMNH2-dependent dimethyl sulfone monooxygenase
VTQFNSDEIQEYRRQHVPVYNDQKLKLGLFGTNCSFGLTMTHAQTTYRPTWEHTREVAQRADEMGFEMLIPIARWRGFGGSTDFNGECFETYTWAAGLAAETNNIMVFATSHIPTMHPIVAAKMATTVDHISRGRFGLNLVMGWFTPEMEMFGVKQREHDDRYRNGAEWLQIVKRLWVDEEPFDLEGEFFRIQQGQAHPKPVQRPHPVLINAGNSPAGIDFSARDVDFNFATIDTLENAENYARLVRQKARSDYNRDIGVMTYGLMVCRETEQEARDAYNAIIEHGDWQAARNIMDVLGIQSQSFGEQIRAFQERFIAGWGGYPMVGTPEQVVDELQKLSDIGMDGVILGFLDYNEELKYFDKAVMPLLKEAGLRK